MATTFFPYKPSQVWSAAGWVVNAVLDTSLSLETIATLKKRALAPAERLVAARQARSTCQGVHKATLATLNKANAKNDAAGSALAAAAGIKGGRELQEKLQVLLGGRRMSDVTSAPHDEEIRVFWDLLARVDADPDKHGLPAERIEALRVTNAAHEAAYLAERAAYKALRAAQNEHDDAEDEFITGYRSAVRAILLELDEAGAAAVLTAFEARPTKDDDDDDE
jgi:hypothetical protein